MKKQEKVSAVARVLWEWFSVHKRTLPWRDLKVKDTTQRAYQVLVSEIMLQQTQVSRVIIIYKNFLEQFPTLQDLAKASNKDVILAWRGMGYNSRALRLRDAAIAIINEHDGVFPQEMSHLLVIKGIGHYTAGAIRNFAFYLPTPCIDTNIRRIVHRTFIGPENPDGTWPVTDKELLPLAEELLTTALAINSNRTTADWHAALMDFGSLVCTKTNPKWDICPLTRQGLMKAAYKVQLLPKRSVPKKEPGRLVGSTFVPNRIFRGRIVEELRNAKQGLSVDDIGARISVDWNPEEHREWLQSLLKKLTVDRLIASRQKKFMLQD